MKCKSKRCAWLARPRHQLPLSHLVFLADPLLYSCGSRMKGVIYQIPLLFQLLEHNITFDMKRITFPPPPPLHCFHVKLCTSQSKLDALLFKLDALLSEHSAFEIKLNIYTKTSKQDLPQQNRFSPRKLKEFLSRERLPLKFLKFTCSNKGFEIL